MYKHNIKDAVTRSGAFAMAVSLVSVLGISAFPALAFADALDPLTERTLLMTSSAPGFRNSDGSGNPLYAPPGSGPNGQKAGHKFSFKVSTDSSGANDNIDGFSFQYCTGAAGDCTSPGNNAVDLGDDGAPGGTGLDADTRPDTAATSDLRVVYPSPAEVSTLPTANANGSALVDRDNSEGNFAVIVDTDADGIGDTLNTGWTMEIDNYEIVGGTTQAVTANMNMIRLFKQNPATDPLEPIAGQKLEVVFYATDTNYITNPGFGAFFVRLNTYKTNDPLLMLPDEDEHILDGGVTVANVMTDSIHITTKVLETMSFSVGTTNPDYEDPGAGVHGPCDPITENEQIQLGDPSQEYSLSVGETWDANSYWRLSSNSSGGASVYYSGTTLSNTVGDQINPAGNFGGTAYNGSNFLTANSLNQQGMEQFGLAFDTTVVTPHATTNPVSVGPGNDLKTLAPDTKYASGAGFVKSTENDGDSTAYFALDPSSSSTPALIASDDGEVVDCSTGKMRYIGNIAAATPAGIYTTKINYLAAPQY